MVASFADPEGAREAMIDLESLGIDANAIRLVDRDPAVQVGSVERSGELDAGHAVVSNYVRGALITAAVVGAVAVVVVLALGIEPRALAVTLALLGGAIAGFVVGGYINAARRLPVNVDALDTYAIDERADDPVRVEVRLDDRDLLADVESVYRKHEAMQVERV
jgi:hypothetical protein